MRRRARNVLLLASTAALSVSALVFARPATGESFAGADAQARDAIAEVSPGYEPWFEPLWEPPSQEIESLLFGLQTAFGAGILGYVLGLRRGRRTGGDRA